MGHRRLTTLLDVARHGYWVELRCRCGHTGKHNPMVLLELVSRRGASANLAKLPLKCSKCGSREITATHCNGPEIWSG